MKILSICVALFGLLALVVSQSFGDVSAAGLGATALLCALATWRSMDTRSAPQRCHAGAHFAHNPRALPLNERRRVVGNELDPGVREVQGE